MREVPEADGQALSFGAYLRQSRLLRELSLQEVATATKLPVRVIEALEADEIPDRAHALLAARSCAAAIGLDPEETALRLEEELQRSPARARASWFRRRGFWEKREPLVWVVLAVTLLACVALFIRWR